MSCSKNIYLSSFFVILIGALWLPFSVHAETKSIEESVRDYFKDTPVMIEIARCESKFRQFNTDGTVLRGGWGGGMIGVFQFFESVHLVSAQALGYDLSTLEGNLGYAKYLYSQSGTTPWNSAKACWGSAALLQKPVASTATTAELEAKVQMLKKLVAQLQELLEKKKKLTQR